MKAIAFVLVFLAIGLPACSLRFGTIGTWSNGELPPTALFRANSVVLPNGDLVFLGGSDTAGQSLGRVLLFDPVANRWSQGAPMPVVETGYSTAALSNGSVLVAGGGGGDGGSGLLASTWLYSPQLDKWSKGGDLTVARSGAASVLLTDGRVLIAGGSVLLAAPNFFGFSNSAETFDPQTNSWSLVGSMQVARTAMTLLALPRGGALAVGGCSTATYGALGGALASAEVFDPTSGAWAATAALPEPRCGASSLVLRDGRALLMGGGSAPGQQQGPVTNAFLYDEEKHTWTAAGSTVAGASSPIQLTDGQVFAAATEAGPVKGALASFVVGGQVFDPTTGDWSFTTSTSVQVPFQLALQGSVTPTVVAQSNNKALVLLGEAGVLTFNPLVSPPAALTLDSSGLTLVLAALAGALCSWLAIQAARSRASA